MAGRVHEAHHDREEVPQHEVEGFEAVDLGAFDHGGEDVEHDDARPEDGAEVETRLEGGLEHAVGCVRTVGFEVVIDGNGRVDEYGNVLQQARHA